MKSIPIVLSLLLLIIGSALPAIAADDSNTGTVQFTQNAGNYMYLKLDQQGKEVWVATTSRDVSVGDKIDYTGALLVEDFHGKSLDKTFDKIYFTGKVRILNDTETSEKKSISEAIKEGDMPQDDVHKQIGQEKKTATSPGKDEITKAENEKTIKEIYAEKESLKGKTVTVRAKVMKVSKNVLGRNWITLRDGSGESPEDKIVAVTSEMVNIDDVHLVKGVLKTDINLGGGYEYKIVLEEASFSK